MLAVLGVFGTGEIWPDVIVAAVMAGLEITGGAAIMRQAIDDMRRLRAGLVPAG